MKDANGAFPADTRAVDYRELLSHPAKCADLNNAPLSHGINLGVGHKQTRLRPSLTHSSLWETQVMDGTPGIRVHWSQTLSEMKGVPLSTHGTLQTHKKKRVKTDFSLQPFN